MASDSPIPEGPSGPVETSVSDDAAWRMLHPASVAVNLIPRTWGFVRSAWPFLVAIFLSQGLDSEGLVNLGLLSFFLLMTVGNTVVHFLTLRYRLVGGRLEITTGLLNRQIRVLSPSKVQNVETVQNLFHKMSGLVEVRIETASGGDIEGMLSALTVSEADRLVEGLRPGHVTPETDDVPVLQGNSLWDLARFGATSSRLGAAAVGFGVLMEATRASDPERLQVLSGGIGWVGGIALLLALISGAFFVGIAGAVMRHWDFRLTEHNGRLAAEEGLFTRRRVELAVDKVQLVSFREPALRRLAGFGSMVVETAAARAGRGGTERALAMVPYVPTEDVDRLVRHALPRADVRLGDAGYERPAPNALKRAWIRGLTRGAAGGAILTWFFWPIGLLGWILLPVELALAYLDHRFQRWRITEDVVVSRRGYLDRSTVIVDRKKLQSVAVHQGPLLRRYGLGVLRLRVAGSSVSLPLLDHDLAFQLAARLSLAVSRPPRAEDPDEADASRRDSEGNAPYDGPQEAVAGIDGYAEPVDGQGGAREA